MTEVDILTLISALHMYTHTCLRTITHIHTCTHTYEHVYTHKHKTRSQLSPLEFYPGEQLVKH